MSDDDLGIPATDAGSETLQRFEYQAKVIFPFVLRCALGGPELSVIPEHIEDCFLQRTDGWWLLQVKSRDSARGYWTLADLLEHPGGALQGLFRSYRNNAGANATYWMLLEQNISPHGEVALLRTEMGRAKPELISQLVKGLAATEAEVRAFLLRLRVKDGLSPRDSIDAVNLRLLMAQSHSLSYPQAVKRYENAIREIGRAMRASPTELQWPKYTEDKSVPEQLRAKIAAKRLGKEQCVRLVGPLGATASALLTRELDPKLPPPTNLERKLLSGGAHPEVITHAKELRARAAMVDAERLAGSAHDDVELEAVQKRLLMHSTAAVARHTSPGIANKAWSALLSEFQSLSEKLDPAGLFHQDGYLLLGELCELSDQCSASWGDNA